MSRQATEKPLAITPPASIGLYIHLPWCVSKCPYCDFNSHAIRDSLPEQAYVDALIGDLTFEARQGDTRPVSSIFFGGGTPSLFSADAIARILDSVNTHYHLADDCEITLEANPGTADAGHFTGYRQAGVNRLSLGFQTLDNTRLEKLGRIHRAEESLHAFKLARDADFDNINIDLMFGLPGQSPEAGMADLEQVISLAPEHLSWYQLTIEPNTRFAVSRPELPGDDLIDQLQDNGLQLLQQQGYARYEVSAFARPGKKSRHNLNYWTFGDYLGVGAGAHGKLTCDQAIRFSRYRHPTDYIKYAGSSRVYQQQAAIPADHLLFEFLLNQFRLVTGFELAHLRRATGVEPEQLSKVLADPIRQGLVELDDLNCRATDRGFRYLNEILLACMPANRG